MLLNNLLLNSQKFFYQIYKESSVLKNIELLIFLSIIALIFYSTFASSDNIAVFAVFTIILTFIKLLTKPNCRINLVLSEKILLTYLMIVIISVAGSTLLTYSIKGFCKTLVYLAFYASVVDFMKTNRDKIKYIFLALALSCFGEVFIAIKQNFLSVAEISGWQDMSRLNPEEVMTRVYGSLKPFNPNLFGGYLLAVLPSTLLFVFIPLLNKHYKTATLGGVIFISSIIALIMTGCRGAYIGLFVELILIAILTYRFLTPFYKKIFLFVATVLSSIGFFLMLSITSLRARLFSMFAMRGDSSNSFRFNVYNSCVQMFQDNWLLGIGVGNQNFREIYGLYMKTGFDALSAYNIYLEIAVESGIFALVTFIAFLFTCIYSALKYIFKRKNINSLYVLISLVSIVGLMVHGFVDTVFFRPQLQFVFWLMIAIIRVLTMFEGRVYVRNRN